MQKRLFDQLGKETSDEDIAFAKEITLKSGNNRYCVKFATSGPTSGFMLDPYSPYFEGLNVKKFDKRNAFVSKYEFKVVKKEVFDLYLHFLKTRKHIFLRQAEREINN